jgi:predicted nuclease of restriction endonuclease-like (RecB) superfamily
MSDILDFGGATEIIKDAIVRSRYQAAKLVNRELLGLYYAVGRYVSDNSRIGAWGRGAIKQLSESLQRELPGLRGFSETSIRNMRIFYENWHKVFRNHQLSTDDLSEGHEELNRSLLSDDIGNSPKRSLPTNEIQIIYNTENFLDLGLLARHIIGFTTDGFSADTFFSVGFTHHSEILAKEKSLDGRLFYISRCATEFWTVDTLKSYLRGDLYAKTGAMPNNFLHTLPEAAQARRAIRAFKDEYLLDFINIEDEIDPEDRDERVFVNTLVSNVKKFILSFGNYFSFVGSQYRVLVDEQDSGVDE